MWQWLIVAALAGFFLNAGFTMGPAYINNFTVQSTIEGLQAEPELGSKSIVEVRSAIERKFDVNQIETIQAVCRDKKRDCLKISKTKTHMLIDANYEHRVHLIGNVDVVMVFDKNVIELALPSGG